MHRKRIVVLVIVIVIIVVGSVGATIFLNNPPRPSAPDFPTVLPNEKSIEALGGWNRLDSPDGNSAYVYLDKIDNVSVSINQQPLPVSFKEKPDEKIAELAKSYNATTKLDADGVTIYIGNSAKGPQSVIFTKKDLLVLIKSAALIDNNDWISYIKSLR